MTANSYAENRSQQTSAEIRHMAKQLRGIADEIEQFADIPTSIRTRRLDHGQAASRAVHRIMWGVANLNIDSLVKVAAEADEAAAFMELDDLRENLLLARRILADQVGHAEAPYTPWALELLAQLGGEPEA